MSEFLIEAYVSRASGAAANARPMLADLTLTAGRLTRDGRWVRFVRSIFVPEEELCFYLFEANSKEVVREAAELSGLHFDRILEATSDWVST
jgi:hypothetical protein